MALTPGFKKFIGLIVAVAVVGGGIYANKAGMFKSTPVPIGSDVVMQAPLIQPPTIQPPTIPQPMNSPINQAENFGQMVAPNTPAPAPVLQQAPVHATGTAASDRGMAALLKPQ